MSSPTANPALTPIGDHDQVAPADITLAAQTYGLRTSLIRAFVRVESGGNPDAFNPEPRYHYLWDCVAKRPFRALTPAEDASESPPPDFHACPGLGEPADAEWQGQQSSWGPMQVMGAVAREAGFLRWFTALCDPYTGIKVGCEHLLLLKHRYFNEWGWEGVVMAYNAGSPQRGPDGKWTDQVYVDKIRNAGGFEGLL